MRPSPSPLGSALRRRGGWDRSDTYKYVEDALTERCPSPPPCQSWLPGLREDAPTGDAAHVGVSGLYTALVADVDDGAVYRLATAKVPAPARGATIPDRRSCRRWTRSPSPAPGSAASPVALGLPGRSGPVLLAKHIG